jgi:phospholipid-transporting ATPase
MTATQFSFHNSFSGQVLFESWTLTFYNVCSPLQDGDVH